MMSRHPVRRHPRQPVGPHAGLRDLLAVYGDASLPFRIFLAHRWWHAHLSDLERCVRPEGTILDLGCGHGIFTNLMALRGPGRRILGLERDSRKAAFASDRVSNVTVDNRDIMRSDFPHVDVVTVTDVLHHLSSFAEQEEILEAIHRVLPSGGQLVVKEISKSRPIRYRMTLMLDRIAFPHDTFYFRHHEELAALLDAKGFTPVFKALWSGTPYGSYAHVCTKR